MVSVLRGVAIAVVIGAAICVPIVIIMQHHGLMPNAAELAQIDAAAQSAAPRGSTVHRLPAPDQVEPDGHAKVGYFTYDVSDVISSHKYRADWRISDGKVQLIAFKRL